MFQAGIIGAWGEWHSSTNGLDSLTNRTAVLGLLNTYLPANKQIAVRQPTFKSDEISMTSGALQNTMKLKLGYHNDCFLASVDDFGTYPSNQIAYYKSVIAADSATVPVGGETCAVNLPRSGCASAVSEMQYLGFSYLNQDYHPDVINGFKTGGCFNQITNQLGYRFELGSSSLQFSNGATRLTGSIQVRNTGWSPMYAARSVKLRFLKSNGTILGDVPLDTASPQDWQPNQSYTSIPVGIDVPSSVLNEATVNIALVLPDSNPTLAADPRYSVQFANVGVWNSSRGDNIFAVGMPVTK